MDKYALMIRDEVIPIDQIDSIEIMESVPMVIHMGEKIYAQFLAARDVFRVVKLITKDEVKADA